MYTLNTDKTILQNLVYQRKAMIIINISLADIIFLSITAKDLLAKLFKIL